MSLCALPLLLLALALVIHPASSCASLISCTSCSYLLPAALTASSDELAAASAWLAPLLAAAAVPWAATTLRRLLRLLHILQLEEYAGRRYLRWLVGDARRLAPLPLGAFAAAALLGGGLVAVGAPAALGLAALAGGAAVLGGVALARGGRAPAKKPLVLTPRALVVLAGAVALGLAGVAAVASVLGSALGLGAAGLALGALAGVAVADALAPGLLLLASLALLPAQAAAREAIVEAARLRLRRSRVRIVGVTGSYGKTSTKEMIAALLGARFRVLKTPASHNTPLGIARLLLQRLRPEHEYLVVEMGAYGRGEIRRLCGIAPPQVGVLTAVGPQHLERFGSLENVAAAKAEIVEALPADGTAVLNYDNPWCRALGERVAVRVLRYGLADDPALDLRAQDVRLTRRGLAFRLEARGHGSAEVRLGLLGRHNAANFLAAAGVALTCGMTLEEIARAAAAVEPVPHRLQLVAGAGGVTVVDDAYNSNPEGARAALEALAELAAEAPEPSAGAGWRGRRVLVTPGLVELGEREADENQALGRAAAAVCDVVILVGPRRTRPIRDGLLAAGFPAERIVVVQSVAEVPERLRGLVAPGDVVLFENDLPDNYDET